MRLQGERDDQDFAQGTRETGTTTNPISVLKHTFTEEAMTNLRYNTMSAFPIPLPTQFYYC